VPGFEGYAGGMALSASRRIPRLIAKVERSPYTGLQCQASPFAKPLPPFGFCLKMDYSHSTFTVEINGMPTVIYQVKWHSEADDVCQGWAQYHWDKLPTKGRHGSDLPPIVKVRLARADERAMYDAEGAHVEFYEGVKIVYLINFDALHEHRSDDLLG
jgi:hypothetical protein